MSVSQQRKILQSSALLLATAVSDLYPTSKVVEFKVSEVDFTCDFLFEQKPSLDLIAERMRALIKEGVAIERLEMMRENGAEFLRGKGQSLMAEQVEAFEENIVPLVRIGEFVSFFPGGEFGELKEIGAFSLLDMEDGGIRGTAFSSKGELRKFLRRADEAKKRDPDRLGRKLELFTREGGQWLWHPKGFALKEVLRGFWEKELGNQGFSFVKGSHVAIYQSFERGEGLLPYRLASFQDGGKETLFCRDDQVIGELISSLQFIERTVRIFGFQCALYFVQGNDREKSLVKALEGFDYEREKADGRSKIELRVFDTLGRAHVVASIEVALGEKLVYKGDDGQDHQPVVISRSTFGSMERFVSLLTEHYAGRFPFWLAPEQLRVIPVTEKQELYADKVKRRLEDAGYRVTVDTQSDKLSARVHRAEKERSLKLLVVGEREEKQGVVALREGQATREVTIDDLLQDLQREDEENLFKR